MWKDGLIRDLLCTISRKHVALSYMNRLCLPALSFYFKQSNQHHHCSSNQHHHCSSKAINIIIFQAKQPTSSFFKQSNQVSTWSFFKQSNQHHFASKQSTSSLFKQSKQHHHFSSNIITFFFFFFLYIYISFQLFAGILSNVFKLGSIIIVLSQQYCDKPRNEPYFKHTKPLRGLITALQRMLSSM